MREAVRRWMRTEKWFPKPAELIALSREIVDDQIDTGTRALPQRVETEPLAERIARKRRIIANAARLNIELHPSVAQSLAELEAERAEKGRAA